MTTLSRGLLLAFGLAALNLSAAVDLSTYRGLKFGMSVDAATKQVGATPSDIRLLHKRPAVIQELDWRPRADSASNPVQSDSIQDAVLGFFNGELFRIIVTYDRDKVEGMTPGDMVDAISQSYGPPARPKVEIAYHSNYAETAAVIARWENPDYSYNLVRTGDQASFALVAFSKRVDALASASTLEGIRIETLEAPMREIEKRKDRENAERLALEKARVENKPRFKP